MVLYFRTTLNGTRDVGGSDLVPPQTEAGERERRERDEASSQSEAEQAELAGLFGRSRASLPCYPTRQRPLR